jgi:phosphatidylglycerol:prolipoprotein diacylglycerol transferase
LNLSYLTLGALHLPVFGLFASAGLIAALLLTQRTAPIAGLSAQRLWNLGLLAILSAFLVSRLLLVATQPHTFLAQPLAILTLPSLTYTGLWITTILVFAYLRLTRLPILPTLDILAPSAALLWLFLALGHFVEGTAAGMPTHLPWGIVAPGDTVLGRTHPVQLYTALVAIALLALLLRQLPRRNHAGDTAALALILGGTTDFLLAMLRQPWDAYGAAPLDHTQFADLALLLAGGILYALKRPQPTTAPASAILKAEALHAQ